MAVPAHGGQPPGAQCAHVMRRTAMRYTAVEKRCGQGEWQFQRMVAGRRSVVRMMCLYPILLRAAQHSPGGGGLGKWQLQDKVDRSSHTAYCCCC
eukprot:1157201-Pelagomonas_calceolata.AAC.10